MCLYLLRDDPHRVSVSSWLTSLLHLPREGSLTVLWGSWRSGSFILITRENQQISEGGWRHWRRLQNRNMINHNRKKFIILSTYLHLKFAFIYIKYIFSNQYFVFYFNWRKYLCNKLLKASKSYTWVKVWFFLNLEMLLFIIVIIIIVYYDDDYRKNTKTCF